MEKLSRIGITHVGILKDGDNSTPAVEPVIEKGIPIPAQGTFTEIARKMQYGDSVLLPYTEARTLMMAIRRTGAYGVQREIGDKLRVWKMEKPVVRRDISRVMSQLGSRKKRMSPEAIKARQAAGRASAKARRERNAHLAQEDRAMAPMAPLNGQSREEASGEI